MRKAMFAVSYLMATGGFAPAPQTPRLAGAIPTNVTIGREGDAVVLRPLSETAANGPDSFATLGGPDFRNGEISVEVSGDRIAGAPETVRAFVGMAFRTDGLRYEAFYLRMYNGRAKDQLQRNHSAQYISHPDWTWERLRRETPGAFETYVDLVPNRWTKMLITVCDGQARLRIDGATQPTLVIRDLKRGAQATGKVALWVGPGTVGRFRALTIDPARGCPLTD